MADISWTVQCFLDKTKEIGYSEFYVTNVCHSVENETLATSPFFSAETPPFASCVENLIIFAPSIPPSSLNFGEENFHYSNATEL